MPAELTSTKNPLLKDVRRAIGRGGLTSDGNCIAESIHLLEEAIRSKCVIETVIASESAYAAVVHRVEGLRGVYVVRVPDTLYEEISATESAQGVMALVKPPAWQFDQLLRGNPLLVILDGIQDPGNAGAILRAAEAFGATGVIFVKGSVNPYNPKAIRASAGSLFRVPLVAGLDARLVAATLSDHNVALYAAMPRADVSLTNTDLSQPCAVVIGSEGRGVSASIQDAAKGLRIPTSDVESLNAAVAAGILLDECWRQRTSSG